MREIKILAFLFFLTMHSSGQIAEYVLQPGDVISITVVEHPEFSGRHKIRPDGRINYPVIGEIDAATTTPAQLVRIMQGKLASYVNNPVVSVSIESYYANKVYIIGNVVRAGQYDIYEPLDVMKAIAMSGGLRRSRSSDIRIIRSDGSVVEVPFNDLFGRGGTRDMNRYVLYPGDTMYVPEGFSVPWSLIATILGIINVSLSITLTIDRLSSR
ncbi:Capsule polysaccharide export protein [Chitinispirillum alkaliphilum]|nr:Capsule polysaccharide export protein [Chitinispirillum alkaliphilum]